MRIEPFVMGRSKLQGPGRSLPLLAKVGRASFSDLIQVLGTSIRYAVLTMAAETEVVSLAEERRLELAAGLRGGCSRGGSPGRTRDGTLKERRNAVTGLSSHVSTLPLL